MTIPNYDILVVGGGPVGAALVCSLADQRLRIGLVEARQPHSEAASYDARSIALAHGSQRIFEALGLWSTLTATNPIRRIFISDQGRSAIACLDHRDEQVDALGHVAEARLIEQVLQDRLSTLAGVDFLAPARVESAVVFPDCVHLQISEQGQSRPVTTRLLIAADGARSPLREQLGVATRQRDYHQHAIIANVTPSEPSPGSAFERFTPSGPLALLPLDDSRYAMVWVAWEDQVQRLLQLSSEEFCRALGERFGHALGRFERCGLRQSYPLHLVVAQELVRHRVAFIGNAAHTLHPVAGQGLNLGLRDVAALAEVLSTALANGEDIGNRTVLERYAAWIRWDQRRTVLFTDGLVRLFSNRQPALSLARQLGLLAFDTLPPAKRWLSRQTMGLSGRQPRLVRGLPLLASNA